MVGHGINILYMNNLSDPESIKRSVAKHYGWDHNIKLYSFFPLYTYIFI